MKIVDNMFFNNRAELLLYFAKASFLYAVTVVLPLIISDRITVNLIINLIMLLFFVINICVDTIINTKYVIGSRDMHISVLFKGMEEYIGVKQNIYQILHTYSDYLEYGEYERLKEYHATLVKATSQSGNSMELARKMNENPSLISLLISKLEYAEKMKVKLIYSLQCDLSTFYIDPMELIRILSCLLDNAIEAAAESNERKVHLSVEARENGSKFLIISNSTVGPVDVDLITTRGVSSKPGHSGIGLTSVRDILEKYGNCSMQIKYLDEEFSAYLEIRENPHSRKES